MTALKMSAAMFLLLATWTGASAVPAKPGPRALSTPHACAQNGPRKYIGLPSGSFYDDDPAERCAIDQAVANGLLGSGYFRIVHDRSESTRAVAGMMTRLRKLGIRATVGRCDWVGLVSQGTAHGNNSYGAACELRLAGQPERSFLICNSQYGGVTLVQPDVYASDRSFVENFIRRACF